MTREDFNEYITHIREVSLDTLQKKNAEYSKGSDNPIHNFVLGGKMMDGTAAQAAWGYMTKHLVALYDKVDRNDFSDLDDLEEKCQDIINYIAFIYAIGRDEHSSRYSAVDTLTHRVVDTIDEYAEENNHQMVISGWCAMYAGEEDGKE